MRGAILPAPPQHLRFCSLQNPRSRVAFYCGHHPPQCRRGYLVPSLVQERWTLACPVAPGVFQFAAAVLTVLAFLLTVLCAGSAKQTVWTYLVFGYIVAMMANVLVPHLAVTMAMSRYMPGLATGVALNPFGLILSSHPGASRGIRCRLNGRCLCYRCLRLLAAVHSDSVQVGKGPAYLNRTESVALGRGPAPPPAREAPPLEAGGKGGREEGEPLDYFLKVAARLGPACRSSITATVLISIRSAHFAAPKWSAEALLDS